MNNHVNVIANRLSLRHPQRDSLQILDRICELLPIQNIQDLETSLATLKAKFPTKILIQQSIGRGLRLPYGMRTGVEIVDRLNIVCHDTNDRVLLSNH